MKTAIDGYSPLNKNSVAVASFSVTITNAMKYSATRMFPEIR